MRRHDMDWLRVIVFGLLIFYHVGMFFVPWGWHIKNNEISAEMRWPMLFVNQWRLPILFVISGMGTYYALYKRTAKQFALERVIRLLIPLSIGMLFIVPPQVFIERLANGDFSGGYLEFWPSQAFLGVYPEGNLSWHHLWFLPYLLLFSLILIPVFIYLRNKKENPLVRWLSKALKRPIGFLWFLIPLFLVESFVEPFFPVTHALIGDWYAIAFFIIFFFYGYLLISVKEVFWNSVEQFRRIFLICGMVAFTLWLLLIFNFEDGIARHFTEAALMVLNLWAWILTLFGYGSRYLNRPSRILSYANEAVYPFYILHQTITIIAAYFLMDLNWSIWIKFVILTLVTFGGSWLIYEFLIRRWTLIRPLFGLKLKKRKQLVQQKA